MAHWHLLLNHLPVLGTVFALGLLVVAIVKRSDELKRVSLDVFGVVAGLAIPAYLTGEPAAELVKPLAGVSKTLIEQHEETAQLALAGILMAGVLALTGRFLFRGGKPIARWLTVTLLALGLVVSSLMAWTANLGGQIRHTEIRSETASAAGVVGRPAIPTGTARPREPASMSGARPAVRG